MKRFIILLLITFVITISSIAQESSNSSSTTRIELEIRQNQNNTPILHRTPALVNIEAYFDGLNSTLEICYDGIAIGEVFLYLNETIIGYNTDINTSFQIATPGLYTIKIISETWIAHGYLIL